MGRTREMGQLGGVARSPPDLSSTHRTHVKSWMGW